MESSPVGTTERLVLFLAPDAARRIGFAGFRAAIAGAVLASPNHEFPSSGIFMNHAAHDLDKFIRAAPRDAQNPRRVSNRRRPALVVSDRVRHGFDHTRSG